MSCPAECWNLIGETAQRAAGSTPQNLTLLGVSRTADVVDAHVALAASERNAIVITPSDDDDVAHLSACLRDPS